MPGTCARCNRGVRLGECKQAFGKSWHTLCFSCRTCRKLLDNRTATAYCGDLYCKSCQAYLSSTTSRGKKCQDLTSLSNKSCVLEEVRLRGGGNEIEVDCYYESNEKPCLHSTCPTKSSIVSPSEESVELRSSTCREVASGKTGCSISRSFNESSHKFPNGQTDCLECTTRCSKSTYGCSQTKETPKCEAPFKIRCSPSKNSRAHQQNLLDTELRRIRDSKELITRYSASETSRNNIPPRKLPHPTPRSPLPSRRRVSFDGVTEINKCCEDNFHSKTMQDTSSQCHCRNQTSCNDLYNHSCDIWRADDKDDCPTKDDDDDYDSAPETSNSMNCEDSRRIDYTNTVIHYPNLQPQTSNEDTKIELRVENTDRNIIPGNESTVDFPLKESESHTSVEIRSIDIGKDERMRGGCCDSYCSHCSGRPSSSRTSTRRVRDHCPSSNNCFICSRSKPCERIHEKECSSTSTCYGCSSCGERCSSSIQDKPICKSSFVVCRQSKGCGNGGCCGSGCRGGCGRPGQTCLPSTQCQKPSCQKPLCRTRPSSAGSSCSSRSHDRCDHDRCDHDRCTVPQICCCSKKPTSASSCSRRTCSNTESYACGSSGTSCCRSCSPGCRSRSSRGCCGNEGGKHSNDGASCCRPKYSGCECLGGGLDCQRCGRKVYQAEMQMVSGSPFHNTCFSCHCCRKPLEPLTYQENCGEIYCKQCYVRNFGPQGYGYGVGAGALQTPL